MSRRVGVDLSSTHAALASVRETRRGLQLRDFTVLDAEGATEAIADDLTQARRTRRFPRAAEVVAWPGDRRVDAVTQSGFRVERVITPGEALARVARMHYRARPASGVTAVVSLHPTSGAVAVVRDGHLLFETQVAWSVAATLSAADSELLRRYTFISELTESLRRVFDMVRTRQRAEVAEILTCGSLADLRSLTMPLAAEFDVEVETLDGTDDVDIRVRDASPQQMRDTIASLRIAIAAGKRWHNRTVTDLFHALRIPRMSLATRAAVIAGFVVLAAFLWVRSDRPATRLRPSSAARTNAAAPAERAAPAPTNARPPLSAPTEPPTGAAASVRVLAAKPPLPGRPLRVNARLQRAPRGLQHATLLLALAKAEQAIATSSVAARQSTAAPPVRESRVAAAAPAPAAPVPAPPSASKPVPRAAAAFPVPASSPASKPAPRVAAAFPVPASPPASKRAPRVAAATAVPPPSSGSKPPARVAAAPPVPAPPPASKPAPRVATALAPFAPMASAAQNPIPAPKPPVAASKSEAAANAPVGVPSAVTRPPSQTAWSASTAAVKSSPDRSVKPITPVAGPAAPPVVASVPSQARLQSLTSGRNFLPGPADMVVTSILWSSDRQLAIVNSRIVGAGDVVGRQTVVEIQADGVVFRDRAGRLRRAGLRPGQPESQ